MSAAGYKLSARAAEVEARRSGDRPAIGHAAGPNIENLASAPVIAGDPDVFEWFGGGQRAAGTNVTPETAMRSSAVWRCVTLISGAMMSATLGVYEHLPNGARRRVADHPYNRFLQVEPNEDMSGPEFTELQAIAMLLRGNGYGLLRQAGNGTLHDIDYYHPSRVMPYRSENNAVWYLFTNLDGSVEYHHSSYVLHFRGPGRDSYGIRGLSAISHHAASIGINLATREYTAGQFERGLLTNDYFSFAGEVTPEQRAAFKQFVRRRGQGVANAHNPLILEKGAEWKRVAITAKDAQLLELLQYSVVDVARIFGTPPHMIGETSAATSWGSGIEQMTIGFKLYTLIPHVRRFAKEWTRKLFPVVGAKVNKLFVDFDVEELQVGDSMAQAEYFSRALGGNQLPGWMTQDEVRRAKNLEPLGTPDSGRVYFPADPGAAPAAAPAKPKKDPANG